MKSARKGCGNWQGGAEGGKGCGDVGDNNQAKVELREELLNSVYIESMLLQSIGMR